MISSIKCKSPRRVFYIFVLILVFFFWAISPAKYYPTTIKNARLKTLSIWQYLYIRVLPKRGLILPKILQALNTFELNLISTHDQSSRCVGKILKIGEIFYWDHIKTYRVDFVRGNPKCQILFDCCGICGQTLKITSLRVLLSNIMHH